MRWLLLFLVVLNAVALFWFGQQRDVESAAGADRVALTSGAPGITLLSELSADKLRGLQSSRQRQQKVVEEAPAVAADVPPPVEAPGPFGGENTEVLAKGQCGFVGPFAEPITVRQIRGRLKKLGIDADAWLESIKIEPIYWVYLRAAPTRAAALQDLRRLHAQGIDAFIVAEGADLNAISLGFFTRKESAEKIRQERVAQGFDAQLVQKERLRDQYWLTVESATWARFDQRLIADFRKEYGEFTRRVRECSVVAAYHKFE